MNKQVNHDYNVDDLHGMNSFSTFLFLYNILVSTVYLSYQQLYQFGIMVERQGLFFLLGKL